MKEPPLGFVKNVNGNSFEMSSIFREFLACLKGMPIPFDPAHCRFVTSLSDLVWQCFKNWQCHGAYCIRLVYSTCACDMLSPAQRKSYRSNTTYSRDRHAARAGSFIFRVTVVWITIKRAWRIIFLQYVFRALPDTTSRRARNMWWLHRFSDFLCIESCSEY